MKLEIALDHGNRNILGFLSFSFNM